MYGETDADVEYMDCCGVLEISHLAHAPTAKKALWDICKLQEDGGHAKEGKAIWAAFMVFTGHSRESYGGDFKRYLERHRLGQVIQTCTKINPNTKNALKTWVWAINHKALAKWWTKHKQEILDEDC